MNHLEIAIHNLLHQEPMGIQEVNHQEVLFQMVVLEVMIRQEPKRFLPE